MKDPVEATVFIQNISPLFVGFQIDPHLVIFDVKSTLAQLGINGLALEVELDEKNRCATVRVKLIAIGAIARAMLSLIEVGAIIGKLFAADERRRVRDPDYLFRMFGRSDRWGMPLLSLGGLHGSNDLILEKVDGRTIAYLSLQNGKVVYDSSMYGFLPTLAKALLSDFKMRDILKLHQEWKPLMPRNVEADEILLVKTLPLHIRTVFGRVVDSLLYRVFNILPLRSYSPTHSLPAIFMNYSGRASVKLSIFRSNFIPWSPIGNMYFFRIGISFRHV